MFFFTDHSPFEDVLVDVGRLRRVPLNRMRVWLVARFCYDDLDRPVTTYEPTTGLVSGEVNQASILSLRCGGVIKVELVAENPSGLEECFVI